MCTQEKRISMSITSPSPSPFPLYNPKTAEKERSAFIYPPYPGSSSAITSYGRPTGEGCGLDSLDDLKIP